MQRSFLQAVLKPRPLGPANVSASFVRRYSSSDKLGSSELFKGTPKFTRVEPKSVNQKAKRAAKNTSAHSRSQGEWDSSGRVELNSKNVGRLMVIGGAVVAGVGLIGVAAYCGGTYFYLRSYWPVPEEVGGGTIANLLYLATYYERLSPNYQRAVMAMEKALDLIQKNVRLSSDSLAVLEIRVRMAECLYNAGDKRRASDILNDVLPVLQNKQQDAAAETDKVDDLLYRLADTLGLAYLDEHEPSKAKQVLSIGLQAVKRMKRAIVAEFNGDDLASYTLYDGINFKEAALTSRLAKAFYLENDLSTSETLFKGTLNAALQHKAHLDLAPRVVDDVRTFKDGWACLDANAMLYLSKIETEQGNIDRAIPWIESARKLTTAGSNSKLLQCIDCEAALVAQLGHIVEVQGDLRKALRKYREAYEYARLNFSDYQNELAKDLERLESK